MRRSAPLQCCIAVDGAAGVLQIGRLIGGAAVLARIAILILRAAVGALAADVSVRKEPLVGGAIHLLHAALLDVPAGPPPLQAPPAPHPPFPPCPAVHNT